MKKGPVEVAEPVKYIDSDNIVPERDWLARVVEPFRDSDIAGAEPLTILIEMVYIVRYGIHYMK